MRIGIHHLKRPHHRVLIIPQTDGKSRHRHSGINQRAIFTTVGLPLDIIHGQGLVNPDGFVKRKKSLFRHADISLPVGRFLGFGWNDMHRFEQDLVKPNRVLVGQAL